MSERSDRLRRAHLESRYAREGLSALQTAKRNGWNVNTLKANLNGNSPFSFEQAKKYAAKFGVRTEWLYDGTGPMREPPRVARSPAEIPVVPWADIERASEFSDAEAGETVVAGNLPSGEYFATDLADDQIDRIAVAGARIIVNMADHAPKDGRFYLFIYRNETVPGRYRSRPVPRIEPFSTNPAHDVRFISSKSWKCVGRIAQAIVDLP